jgi:hypothetical protein
VTRECLDIQRVKRREVAHRAPYRHASVETMEKALEILMVNPGLSGSQLGRTLGKSVSNGRYIRAQLLPLLNSNGAGNGHLSKK